MRISARLIENSFWRVADPQKTTVNEQISYNFRVSNEGNSGFSQFHLNEFRSPRDFLSSSSPHTLSEITNFTKYPSTMPCFHWAMLLVYKFPLSCTVRFLAKHTSHRREQTRERESEDEGKIVENKIYVNENFM